MHLDTWTSFFLPVIPSSMDRLNTSSYMSNYNKHRYIANVNVDILHICHSQGEGSLTWGSPSFRFLLFSPKSFFFFFFRFFLTWVEELTTDSVITLKTVKASEANIELGL